MNTNEIIKRKSQEVDKYFSSVLGYKSDNIRKYDTIVAMEKSLGVISKACKMADISRETYYTWYKEDKEFRKYAEQTKELAKDFVESNLHKQIGSGNAVSTIYYLKCKAKDRGYGDDGSQVSQNIQINLFNYGDKHTP